MYWWNSNVLRIRKWNKLKCHIRWKTARKSHHELPSCLFLLTLQCFITSDLKCLFQYTTSVYSHSSTGWKHTQMYIFFCQTSDNSVNNCNSYTWKPNYCPILTFLGKTRNICLWVQPKVSHWKTNTGLPTTLPNTFLIVLPSETYYMIPPSQHKITQQIKSRLVLIVSDKLLLINNTRDKLQTAKMLEFHWKINSAYNLPPTLHAA